MSEGINRVTLLGNLGADPELRQASSGAILRIRLATTEGYFDKRSNERKERTDWHSVTVFGPRAEALGRILSKGSSILVEGRIQTSSYEKDGQKVYRTDIIANNIVLVGGKRESGHASPDVRPDGTTRTPERRLPPEHRGHVAQDDFGANGFDDDIPF